MARCSYTNVEFARVFILTTDGTFFRVQNSVNDLIISLVLPPNNQFHTSLVRFRLRNLGRRWSTILSYMYMNVEFVKVLIVTPDALNFRVQSVARRSAAGFLSPPKNVNTENLLVAFLFLTL